MAPGLGKTVIWLWIFKILRAAGLVDCLFVISKKKIVQNVWPREVKKWKGLEDIRISIVHGNRKAALEEDAELYLMNFEGLPWLAKQKRLLKSKGKIMLAIDESSRLRNSVTKRFRALKKILPLFIRRYIGTGSPAPRGLMNLFSQVYILDLGASLGKFITQYRNRFFMPAGYKGYEWVPQDGAEKRIFKAIAPLIIRYGHDQLDLPPLKVINRWVELPKKARAMYDELEKEFIVNWQSNEIVAANAAVASGKLRQIANGGIFIDERGRYLSNEKVDKEKVRNKKNRKFLTIHNEKEENLLDLLEELNGEPALVAVEFKHDYKRIQNYFKKHDAPNNFINAPLIDGGTKDSVVNKIIDEWERGEHPVVFGNPESIAHGLNLQGKGGIVIYYAMTWNLENYEQFYQRVWRQGQRRRVLLYRILVRNTVDETMRFAIRSKDKTQQSILKAMEKQYGFRKKAA